MNIRIRIMRGRKMEKGHKIEKVLPGSIGEELELEKQRKKREKELNKRLDELESSIKNKIWNTRNFLYPFFYYLIFLQVCAVNVT